MNGVRRTTAGFDPERRELLWRMAGLGALLGAPAHLPGQGQPARGCQQWAEYFYERPMPDCRGKQSFFENPIPQRLVVAEPLRPGQNCQPYDIRAFGARGDGKALDTPAINRAIEAAAAKGGAVYFPAGTYLCFSIRLASNVTLYLDHGATIAGARPKEHGGGYDTAKPGQRNALIWGDELDNVSILGPGLLWGQGLTRGRGGEDETAEGMGNATISLWKCRRVTLRDIAILHGGHIAVRATGTDNLTIDNILIDTNRDAINIDACHNVRIANCTINSPWDDAIAPKSSSALGYARATEGLTITNCFLTGGYHEGTVLNGTWKEFEPGDSVLRVGRIKFGTGSIVGFKNITISNCVLKKSGGVLLESVDGALLEDVTITNLSMSEVSDAPLFLRLGRRMHGPAGLPIGRVRRINVSDIVASGTAGRYGSILSGIPGHPIEDVQLSNIHIQSRGGGSPAEAAVDLPEMEADYPEPSHFGTTPAYGFYVRHVRGLKMSHIVLEHLKADARPAFVFNDVQGVELLGLKAQVSPGATAVSVRNARDFHLNLSPPLGDRHFDAVDESRL
mgnify:CR=1 FL=1